MPSPTVRVTEEVARFAFEVFVQERIGGSMYVAFSNPTAGPWKTVKMRGVRGEETEVHRFGIFDQRPDLVLHAPSGNSMLVLEAKSEVEGLLSRAQMCKARDAFNSFVETAHGSANPLLSRVSEIIPGFLWASIDFPREVSECQQAVAAHWRDISHGFVCIGVQALSTDARFTVTYSGIGQPPSIAQALLENRYMVRLGL